MTETPEPVGAGLSARRDRMWGLVGGPLGVAVGVGSAVIAVYVEGADPSSSSSAPYPPFFAKRQLLVYDLFLAPGDRRRGRVRGGIVLTRRSPYPRTDAGTLLVSAILTVLGAGLLFTRLVAVIRAV